MIGARLLSAVVCLLPLGGCASLSTRCDAGMATRTLDTLYFGTARADGVVTADEWRDFLARSITPRFPDGLTTWHADGQWRGADGGIVRETSYVLQLVHADDRRLDESLQAVSDEYRARFAQEAVMRVRTTVCVGF